MASRGAARGARTQPRVPGLLETPHAPAMELDEDFWPPRACGREDMVLLLLGFHSPPRGCRARGFTPLAWERGQKLKTCKERW